MRRCHFLKLKTSKNAKLRRILADFDEIFLKILFQTAFLWYKGYLGFIQSYTRFSTYKRMQYLLIFLQLISVCQNFNKNHATQMKALV